MKKITFIIFLIFSTFTFFSQESLKSLEEEYYDFLSLKGITESPYLGYRTLSDSEWIIEGNNIWESNNLGKTKPILDKNDSNENWFLRGIDKTVKIKIFGPEWFNSFNTDIPFGQNDGGLWQGRGYNTSLTTGLKISAFGLEATFKPQISFSQNMDFTTLEGLFGNKYSYYFREQNIDLVQRYGDTSFWNFDFGDSEIRYTYHTFTLGFGTQLPWLGPAWLNPMLGSNTANSYPKFDIGLRKTKIDIPNFFDFGEIEGRIWLGYLSESDYFDNDISNNHKLLTALSASYAPSFIPGLTIGINRIFLTQPKIENISFIGRLFTLSRYNGWNTDNDEDQKVSLFAYWKFPAVGFEVFGEFGIDDFSSDELSNPFHTAIYTVGTKQIIPLPFNLESELIFEWNNFEMSQDFQLQWKYMGYYAHSSIKQGYTNNGQILGSGSGYFGNSQYIGYSVYFPKGKSTLFFHRFCPNNNSIYSKAVGNALIGEGSELYVNWYANFETYFVFGLKTNYFILNNLALNFEIDYMFIKHYHYIKDSTINNFHFEVGVKLNF